MAKEGVGSLLFQSERTQSQLQVSRNPRLTTIFRNFEQHQQKYMTFRLTNFLLLTKTQTKKSQSFSDKRVRFANFKHKISLENYPEYQTKRGVLENKDTQSATVNTTKTTHIQKALLFLNHGLKRNDVTKIQTSLGKYNIKLTKVPVRILSSFKTAQQSNPSNTTKDTTSASLNERSKSMLALQVKQKMYGEMFLLYSTNSSYGNQCLDFLHQQLLFFLLQKQSSLATGSRNLTYQKLLSNSTTASNHFPNASIIYNNIFSIENANDILP